MEYLDVIQSGLPPNVALKDRNFGLAPESPCGSGESFMMLELAGRDIDKEAEYHSRDDHEPLNNEEYRSMTSAAIRAHLDMAQDLVCNFFKTSKPDEMRIYANAYDRARWKWLDAFNEQRIDALFREGIDVFNNETRGFWALVLYPECLIKKHWWINAVQLAFATSQLEPAATYCSTRTRQHPTPCGPMGFSDLLYHARFTHDESWPQIVAWIFVYDGPLFYAYAHRRGCGYFFDGPGKWNVSTTSRWRVDAANHYIMLPEGYLCPDYITDADLRRIDHATVYYDADKKPYRDVALPERRDVHDARQATRPP